MVFNNSHCIPKEFFYMLRVKGSFTTLGAENNVIKDLPIT